MGCNQEEQEYTGEQASWAHDEGFAAELMREGGVPLSDREEPGNTVTSGSSMEKPHICPRGLWEGSSRKIMHLKAKLKCLYTNVHSIGN